MPTILYVMGWRFFFYSNEGDEPIHIHFEYFEFIEQEWNRLQKEMKR